MQVVIHFDGHLVKTTELTVKKALLNKLQMLFIFFHQGAPCIIRADCGTENVVTAGLQRYFRSNSDDVFAAQKSFMYGTSPANQVNRIPCIISV